MDQIFDIALLESTIRMVTPILLAALGAVITSRAGVFNIGLEGLILIGAFFGILGNYLTGNLFLAVLFAIVSSGAVSLILAVVIIKLKANEVVAGISINFLAIGMTNFMLLAFFGMKGSYYDSNMVGLPMLQIPIIKNIPILKMLSGHTIITYFSYLLVIGIYYFLFKTVVGFRLRAIGESPESAKSLGLNVNKYKYLSVLASGVLCGLAGVQLSLGQVTMFTSGMTAGKGYIALVANMLGQMHPIGTLGASLLFGLMDAVSIRLQGLNIPTQFTLMLPYLITLISLFFFRKKNITSGGN